MIKVLIICKKLENSKKILNNIVNKISNLQLIGIANSYYEAKDLLVKNQADIIITTDPKSITFIKNVFITYVPGIVIIDNILRVKENYPKLLLISNENSFDYMANKIMFFIKHAIEHSQKQKVANILNKIGFDYNLSGTIYLQDAILYAHSYKGSYHFENVKRDIYSIIALSNKSTNDRVKWAIERAIKYLYKKNDRINHEYIEKVFRIKYPQRLTPKQIISVISNLLDVL